MKRRRRSRRQLIAGLAVVLLILAIGLQRSDLISRTPQYPGANVDQAGAGVRGLIVEPDDGREPILRELESAHTSIDVMIYLLTDDPIVNALADAEVRGVQVRVIIEQYPYGGFGNPEEVVQRLRRLGVEVKWSSSAFTFTHAKTLIVDDSAVAVLNLNLTKSSFQSNREFGVLSTWPVDIASAHAIFEADWAGDNIADPGSLIVSPINSRVELLALIAGATVTVDVYAEVVTDQEIVEALEAAEARGVDVRLVMPEDDSVQGARAISGMVGAGVEVRFAKDLYIHAKAIVVDGDRAYVGSENFTKTSLDENREIGVIFGDPAMVSRLESVFLADFSAGNSPS